MTKFIFKGIYYPVLGSSVGWCNYETKCIVDRRFGGWENADKWWSFSYGIHCELFDVNKPYFQFVIDKIVKHPTMCIVKYYFNNNGYMYYVEDIKGATIGNIRDAYYLSDLIHFRSSSEESKQICCGWSVKEQKAYGWSHRAKVGFGLGDKIFEENFGDETTPFTQHGNKPIETYEDAMQAAVSFAKYIG